MVRLRDDLARFLAATAPEHDDVQREMAAYSDEHGFPIIGPEAGGVLRLLARLTDAERVFELGSGYGYSAYWFLEGMDGGEVVLTEIDEDELEMARDFFERAGVADRATFEHGDAVEILERYDGPFDVVLMDHQKSRYAEAFERLRERVRPGGVVVADNVVHGPIDFDDLLAYVEGGAVPGDDSTRGVGEYLDVLRADDAYETSVLPVGSGVTVSVRVE
jgi:predicted O-methyltransferase YrrM